MKLPTNSVTEEIVGLLWLILAMQVDGFMHWVLLAWGIWTMVLSIAMASTEKNQRAEFEKMVRDEALKNVKINEKGGKNGKQTRRV